MLFLSDIHMISYNYVTFRTYLSHLHLSLSSAALSASAIRRYLRSGSGQTKCRELRPSKVIHSLNVILLFIL